MIIFVARFLIENVFIKGTGNGHIFRMSITAYGNKIPSENIFEASNCVIYNFQQQRCLESYLDLSIDDNLTDSIILKILLWQIIIMELKQANQ